MFFLLFFIHDLPANLPEVPSALGRIRVVTRHKEKLNLRPGWDLHAHGTLKARLSCRSKAFQNSARCPLYIKYNALRSL